MEAESILVRRMIPLSIRYPNGQPYKLPKKNGLLKKQTKKKKISHSKRGMTLEEDLNVTNEQYRKLDKAIIHKKPTPIQVVNVDYPKRSAAKITEAYYRKASTTDYNGVYKGFYLDFEAKETQQKQSFPLKNFHEHQITHMEECLSHGAICFVILRFSVLNRVFVLESTKLFPWWKQQFEEKGRKSIPLSSIEKEGYEIFYGFSPRLPYLDAVDKLLKDR
jgi:recombination protein U